MMVQLKIEKLEKAPTQNRARIYLDVSRLLAAGRRSTPSGIERVELAYALQFRHAPGTCFVASFMRRLHFLPYRFALSYIAVLENSRRHSDRAGRLKAITSMVFMYATLLAISLRSFVLKLRVVEDNSVYLNLSHENLMAPNAIVKFKASTGAKLLFFVHDLIPITHPEYVRPGMALAHRRRMDTVAALADAVLVNSAATKTALLSYLGNPPGFPEIHVVHLGVAASLPARLNEAANPAAGLPYFLVLATIEPRKNHLLLLNLWRTLIGESVTVPRLIIAGRRGWENEMVLDMLERCDAIADVVEERRDLADAELGRLLQGARAVLLPSFAEGYGLPVAEALAAGAPVICSDLPALREVGGDVPEYIDPLDGLAWRQAILAYSQASSPRRALQCERMRSWSAPRWERHFEQVSAILEDLVQAGHPQG